MAVEMSNMNKARILRKTFVVDHVTHGIQVRHWGKERRPRYYRQKDGWRCGPIAVLNALKWAGAKAPWRTYRDKLCAFMECCKYHGTEPQKVEDALRKWGKGLFTVRYRTEKLPLREIRRELDLGRAIVCDFGWPKASWVPRRENTDGHYALLVDRMMLGGEEYFGLVNLGLMEESAVEYISAKMFRKLCLRRSKDDNFWILRKLGE